MLILKQLKEKGMEERIDEISARWDGWIGEHGADNLDKRKEIIQSAVDTALSDLDTADDIKDLRKSVLKVIMGSILSYLLG